MDVEYQQLKSEIQRVTESTVFNGFELLNGTGGMIDIQVGVNNDPFRDRISFNSGAANASVDALSLTAEAVETKEGAQLSLDVIDQAMTSVERNSCELWCLTKSSSINIKQFVDRR